MSVLATAVDVVISGDVTFVAHNHCNWSMHLFAVRKCSQNSDKSTFTQKIKALLFHSVIFPFCVKILIANQSISRLKNSFSCQIFAQIKDP